MNDPDFNKYSDEQILKGILNLRAMKFISFVNGFSALAAKLEQRGKLTAQKQSDEEINDIIRRMFTGEGGNETNE